MTSDTKWQELYENSKPLKKVVESQYVVIKIRLFNSAHSVSKLLSKYA